jgi:gamma-glutamylcyclotransferase (GGCT)/AIG2-like uncharacterized protein YtfP
MSKSERFRIITAIICGLIVLAAILATAIHLRLQPGWLSAGADLLMAIGTVTTALWAVTSYRSAKRAEKSRWMKELFSEFFFNNNFDEVRDLIEFGYKTKLEPLLYQASLGRYDEIDTTEERRLIKEIDNFLNYLEYVLYLRDNRQIGAEDVEVTFGYWIGVLADSKHAVLRHYCENFGYERVFALINDPKRRTPPTIPQLFAVYGSLMPGEEAYTTFRLDSRAKDLGPCRLPGQLLDLGEYPGLLYANDGSEVRGHLFSTTDKALLIELDAYEVFLPDNFADSEYQRIIVPLCDQPTDAWVYYYTGPTEGFSLVPDGDWPKARKQKSP